MNINLPDLITPPKEQPTLAHPGYRNTPCFVTRKLASQYDESSQPLMLLNCTADGNIHWMTNGGKLCVGARGQHMSPEKYSVYFTMGHDKKLIPTPVVAKNPPTIETAKRGDVFKHNSIIYVNLDVGWVQLKVVDLKTIVIDHFITFVNLPTDVVYLGYVPETDYIPKHRIQSSP